jgi:prepilin-type N-terminal cleavage/methylation domain-containing protein
LRLGAGNVSLWRTSRRGFTLVEVIVVLVILAILAAIAIPALTGYIDKAEEKKYIAQARNTSVAIRTVLVELWADGDISKVPAAVTAFEKGFVYGISGGNGNAKGYSVENISNALYDNSYTEIYYKAADLIGEQHIGENDPGYWEFVPTAAKDSDATAATADGFNWTIYLDGRAVGDPVIVVTHKLTRKDGMSALIDFQDAMQDGDIAYSPGAGYEVYRLIIT